MGMSVAERLREWRQVVATAPVAEAPEVLGGRRAEQFLSALVRSHYQFQGASLYPGRRVPAAYRRREIDLIVVTARRIHVIEIKNWSGSLRVVGNRWVQTNRNGRVIEHPDLAADHQDRSAALIDYLRGRGVALDPKARSKYLSSKIIFMNPRLAIHDKAIADHPDVLIAGRLDAYLNQRQRFGIGDRIVGSVIQWCLDTETAGAVMDGYLGALTTETVAAVRTAVADLSTWDSLRYHGSKVENGDVLRLSVGGRVIVREQIGRHVACPVRWTRRPTLGLIRALIGVGPPGRLHLPGDVLPITTRDFVLFHRAGEPDPAEIPLLKLNEITIG